MSKKASTVCQWKRKINSGAARQRDIGVQIIADVDVTLQDAWKRRRGSAGKMASESWLEKHLGAMKTFGTDRDDEPSQLAAEPSLQESARRGPKILRGKRQEENSR